MHSLCSSLMCIYFTINSTVERVLKKHAITQWIFTDHLIVLFRLGWLTVLSSMNIVEQELYFFESRPGETFGKDKHLICLQKDVPYNQAHNHKTNSKTHSLTWFMWLLFLLSRTEKKGRGFVVKPFFHQILTSCTSGHLPKWLSSY